MAVVKEGPDVLLFTHPSALTKLALWVGEAIAEQERDRGEWKNGKKGTPLVIAGLNEQRGVYVVVGTGGGGGQRDLGGREREERKAEKTKKRLEKERARNIRKEAKAALRASRAQDEDAEEEEEDESETEIEEEDLDESDDEAESKSNSRGYNRNRFGNAFAEVVDETNARVRIDSFEHCVVEVKKEDLSRFLEALSMRAVIG